MKFITEEDLRELFKKEPFTSYEIKAGQRLTPGGRQFLLDRGVKICEHTTNIKAEKKADNKADKPKETISSLKKKILDSKLKSMEAMFLASAREVLSTDPFLAQSVIKLSKTFSDSKRLKENSSEKLWCKDCTGIKIDNFSDNLDDCFEITEFHIQLEIGREIIILHKLRCALRELGFFMLEHETNHSENGDVNITEVVNQSINTLSQMICSIMGGKKCQKEN